MNLFLWVIHSLLERPRARAFQEPWPLDLLDERRASWIDWGMHPLGRCFGRAARGGLVWVLAFSGPAAFPQTGAPSQTPGGQPTQPHRRVEDAQPTPRAVEADADLGSFLRENPSPGVTWFLLHRAEEAKNFQPCPMDDGLLKLWIDGPLGVRELPPALADHLWKAEGWGQEAHWLLASSEGEVVGDGPGQPTGEAVAAILREQGFTSRWDQRAAFLEAHPENGEAWVEQSWKAFRLVRLRMRSLAAQGKADRRMRPFHGIEVAAYTIDDPDPAERERQADRVFQEVGDAVEGLVKVDGWWESASALAVLPLYGAQDSPRMRRLAASLLTDLEDRLSRGGSDIFLEDAWVACHEIAGLPMRELPEIPREPGDPGFPMGLLRGCVNAYVGRQDWEGALAFLDGLPAPGAGRRWTQEAWESHCATQATAAGLRIRPLWELGRAQETRAALESMRAWSGPVWKEPYRFALLIPRSLQDEPFFKEIAAEPALPAPAPPPQDPMPILALLGDPPWRKDWERLRRASPLLPWGGGDLAWSVLEPGAAAALAARAGLEPGPRWALLRGEAVLATGERCPAPEALAGILAREAPSRLGELNLFLERHPEHLGARRARMALLIPRMPEPRLEPLLAEDARVASGTPSLGLPPHLLAFGPDAPWMPDPALWQWSSQQVLPRIETLLRSWPRRKDYWKDWLAWARFHPSKPAVTDFAGSLTIWGDATRWLGSLPPEVAQAIVAELRRTGDFSGMVRWLGGIWEGTDHTPAASLTEQAWTWEKNDREKLLQAVVEPLCEAYCVLKRPEDAKAAETTYRLMMAR